MSSPRLMNRSADTSFKDRLLGIVRRYQEDVKEKWFRKTGYERALSLPNRIKQLTEVEKLNDTQLMWRMYAYVAMQRGQGPLGTSTQLRRNILNGMASHLNIPREEVSAEVARIITSRILAVANGGNGYVGYAIPPEEQVRDEVLMRKIRDELRSPVHQKPGVEPSEEYAARVDKVIAKYQQGLEGSCCGVKLGRRTGYDRAISLREHIASQLVATEQLSDDQLMWRLCEYMKYDDGVGILDTSKELRNLLANDVFVHVVPVDEAEKVVQAIDEHSRAMLIGMGAAPHCYAPIDLTGMATDAKLAKIYPALRKRANEQAREELGDFEVVRQSPNPLKEVYY